MTPKSMLLAIGTVAALSLSAWGPAFAHGPGAASGYQPWRWHYGWHMGPMMGQGQPGQGQMPMMGPGMMGPGMMGPGMMGQGMMGPGMMGFGMMGPGMMGQGMGSGMMPSLREDLSAEDVRHMMEHRLAWSGNPNVKLGKVEEKDDDTIVAEIVTQDGSLVRRLEVNRHTGWTRPAQ